MITPEGKIKAWLNKEIKTRWPEAKRIRWPAGQYGSKGIADDILCLKGYFIAIESKADNTKDATLMQKEFGKEVEKAGGLWLLLQGKDYTIFDKIERYVNDR